MKKLLPFNLILGVILLVCLSTAGKAQVVISQIFGGGGTVPAQYKSDFLELYNRGTTAVNLAGMSLQYSSSSTEDTAIKGKWTKNDLPSFTLEPGKYFLIKGFSGSGGSGIDLPTPDFTITSDFASSRAKIALVNSTSTLPRGCPITDPAIVDFVGYGDATPENNFPCFEGTGPTPRVTVTTAAIRLNGGCLDNNDNTLDFIAGLPTPRNSSSPLNPCAPPPAQILLQEDFDYPIGTFLNTVGWGPHSGSNTTPIDVAAGLTFPGYIGSGIGGAANVDNTGEDVNRTFPVQTSGTVYTAFVIQTQATNNKGYFLHLGEGNIGTNFFSRVFVNATGNAVGISPTSSDPATWITITPATPTLIVVKLDIATKTTRFYVLNTFPESEPLTPNATITETSVFSNVGSIALRQYSSSQRIIVDGIRVATNWNDAVKSDVIVNTPTISVNSPSTGAQWRLGTTNTISWTASNTSENVKIEFTGNASAGIPTWTALNSSIAASSGAWAWDIPANQPVSTDCKIRISDIPLTASGSSGTFRISAPPKQKIMITEIMYNAPDGGNDTIEFIELYNVGSAGVNIKDWFFSEGVNFTFPDYIMAPNTYYVVAREATAMKSTFGITCPQWTSDFLDDLGELIVLKDNFGQVIDSVFYMPTDPWPTAASNGGPSLTFCNPDLDNALAENWSASANQIAVNSLGQPIYATPGATCNSGAKLVITEIMYNPPESGTDSLEFIELYNAGNTINLQGFSFSAGVVFVFPSKILANGEYLLVAAKSSAIQNTFRKASLQWTSGSLVNTGEAITLKDNYGNIIDDVTYSSLKPWDTLANGRGPSLTLCDLLSNNTLPVNWTASIELAATNSAGVKIYATPLGGCIPPPPPVANFNATPTFVIAGGTIQFKDLSENAPTIWEWTFPGGTPATSTLQNPLIQYNTAGLYTVTLTVKNAYGTNTMTKTSYINVGGVGVNYLSSDVALFPNPTSGKVSLTNPKRANQQIVVYSAIGKPVAFKNSDQEIISLDLTGQNKGVYLVKITNKLTQATQVSRIILK